MDPMTDDYIGKVRELAAKIHAEASRPDWEGCTLRELIDELYDLIHDVEGLFTAREIATILYALRQLQSEPVATVFSEHFDEVSPLTHAEIDTLCERINLSR